MGSPSTSYPIFSPQKRASPVLSSDYLTPAGFPPHTPLTSHFNTQGHANDASATTKCRFLSSWAATLLFIQILTNNSISQAGSSGLPLIHSSSRETWAGDIGVFTGMQRSHHPVSLARIEARTCDDGNSLVPLQLTGATPWARRRHSSHCIQQCPARSTLSPAGRTARAPGTVPAKHRLCAHAAPRHSWEPHCPSEGLGSSVGRVPVNRNFAVDSQCDF